MLATQGMPRIGLGKLWHGDEMTGNEIGLADCGTEPAVTAIDGIQSQEL